MPPARSTVACATREPRCSTSAQEDFEVTGRVDSVAMLTSAWMDCGVWAVTRHPVAAVTLRMINTRVLVVGTGVPGWRHHALARVPGRRRRRARCRLEQRGCRCSCRATRSSVRGAGQVGWRFVSACPPEVKAWSVMLGQKTSFLTIPIGDGRVYCYCYCDAASQADAHRRENWTGFNLAKGAAIALEDALVLATAYSD